MKHFLLTILLFFTTIAASSQYRYSIEDCWEMAKNNYPSIKFFNLIEKSRDYSLLNVSENKLPKKFDAISYARTEEQEQKALVIANKNKVSAFNALHSNSNTQPTNQNPLVIGTLQANLYILSDRINNLFFSLILIDKKLQINEMQQMQIIELTKIFTSSKEKFVNNTINLKGLNTLLEKTKDDYTILKNLQKLYFEMMSQMIGRNVDSKTILLEPNIKKYTSSSFFGSEVDLIDHGRYNPFTNNVNYTPKYTNYSNSNYKVFNLGKVKSEEKKNTNNYTLNNLKKNLFNVNTKEQQENQRSEINNIYRQIENDKRMIELHKEIIVISYNKIMRGVPDISNLTQSILNYVNVHNDLAAHTIQLMMSANKFKLLYD